MSNLTLSPHYLEVGVNLLWNSAVNMDDFVAMLQAKLGPMTFGAILGFVLQVLIFRPKNWVLAAERAGAAIVTLNNANIQIVGMPV